MIEIDNRTNVLIDSSIIEKIADFLTHKDIELILTTNEEIQQLNKKFRHIDKATDVLSFPLEDTPHAPLGSIVISVEKAQEEATRYGHTIDEEIALLFIHALLHLLGYDHETDSGEMRKKEAELIEHFQLPSSLIIRNEK